MVKYSKVLINISIYSAPYVVVTLFYYTSLVETYAT